MPSISRTQYESNRRAARTLTRTAGDPRLRAAHGTARAAITSEEKQRYYHAALAAHVAAWEAYIERLVGEFLSEVASPGDAGFTLLHDCVRAYGDYKLGRFNTPNWENSRALLIECTRYDPHSDWTWPRRGWNSLQVKTRLNEILQVRHSFAHGYAIPPFSWTRHTSGRVRLTAAALADVDSLLATLVQRTDAGMRTHVLTHFGRALSW